MGILVGALCIACSDGAEESDYTLPALDYNGADFQILSGEVYCEIFAQEETGDALEDAQYRMKGR